MKINYTTDFFDRFLDHPKPIILFESQHVAVNTAQAYINLLSKYNIKPALVINEKNYISPDEIQNRYTEGYILITSGAERLKKSDVGRLKDLSDEFTVYYDFPFEVSMWDIPYLRTYDPDNRWYWDMINAGIPEYDKDPKAYVEGCFFHNGITVKNSAMIMCDISSELVNVHDGIRKTIEPLGNTLNNVYILGACIAYGDRIDDKRTIASLLQYRLNKAGKKYKVYNMGVNNTSIENNIFILNNIDLKNGDYVFYIDAARTIMVPNRTAEETFVNSLIAIKKICDGANANFIWLNCPPLININNKSNFEKQRLKHGFNQSVMQQYNYLENLKKNGMVVKPYVGVKAGTSEKNIKQLQTRVANVKKVFASCSANKISAYDLLMAYERPHEFMEIYTDNFHIGYMGYSLVANFIYEYFFVGDNSNFSSAAEYESALSDSILSSEMKSYIDNLKKYVKKGADNVGSIVMNCNPFTKGHRYLIEKALEECDYLYIFVVEEDLSEFSFAERFEMVKEGTKDLENVMVLPSGKFIISSLSFPEYFTKEQNATSSFDASKDLAFFSAKIAPALNIKKRFVGEEPLDVTTNEYNVQMKKILNQYGIDTIEVPRLTNNDQVINATQVRKWMKEGNYDAISEYVPDSTFEVIKKHKI